MKQLLRNKQKFYYALSDNELEEVLDEQGQGTGEYAPKRLTPIEVWGNISVPTGFTNIEKFGSIVSYDIVITLEDKDTPINDNTVLWVYTDPEKNEPWDFMVRRVARSLNSATLQCAEAKVTYNAN